MTTSQLFSFVDGDVHLDGDGGSGSMVLASEGAEGTCLVVVGGKLDQAACTGGAEQVFTLG